MFRKPDCLNPQEPVTLGVLHRQGFLGVESIQMGQCLVLTIRGDTKDEAIKTAQAACKDKLLVNDVPDYYVIAGIKELDGSTSAQSSMTG